jgi:glyoxylase-like metal-dependent hydrolase (beta-lactamase superfamily II)
MWRTFRILVATAAIAASVPTGQAQDTRAVLEAAGRTLGAIDLTTISYAGSGTNNAFGQAYAPGGPWPEFKVTSYVATIDYRVPAMRVEINRTNPDGQIRGGGGLPLVAPQTQVQVVNGAFAWNVAGTNATAAPAAVDDRVRAIWLSPHGVIKAALVAGTRASITTERGGDGKAARVITFPVRGVEVKATLTDGNLIERVQTIGDDPWLGDVVTETSYSGYRDFGGVQFPTRIAQTQAGFPTLTLTITDVRPNVEVALDVPPAVRQAPPPAVPAVVTSKLAEGVYHFSGAFQHSVAVEFRDHVVLIDPGSDDTRAHDVFEATKRQIPNKPIRYVINTHHHFDHLGGLRYVVAEGPTIITQAGTRSFYEQMLARPHTVKPDRLAQSPRKAVIETVADTRVLTDGSRQLVIHRIQGFSHCDTMLMAYLPAERILIETDAYNPPPADAPPAPAVSPLFVTLHDNIQRLKLDVDRIAPLHGRLVTMNDLRAAIGQPISR